MLFQHLNPKLIFIKALPMIKPIKNFCLLRRLSVLAAIGLVAGSITLAKAEPIIALTTDSRLLALDSSNPQSIFSTIAVTGLQTGEQLVGIDFRPANALLYGVGSSSRLYSIDLSTGAATAIGSAFTPTLNGAEFGVDFNPVPDRIRVVSDSGQNLRVNPDTGAVAVDTALSYDSTDPSSAQTPQVPAIAYTNNFSGATTATVFGIDSGLDVLTRLGSVGGSPVSPNSGTMFTLGSLGVNTSTISELDISSVTGEMFASLTRSGQTASELYGIGLGESFPAFRYGSIPASTFIRGIAVPLLDVSVPTISVTVPQKGRLRTSRATATVSGTAADNLLLKSVEYRTGNKQFTAAAGTTAWSINLTGLNVGLTNLEIKAIDIYGNESIVSTVSVKRLAKRRLQK
jgi:hypothetical protein